MCVCEREREGERERQKHFDNADDAAFVVADAHVDAIAAIDSAAIDVAASVDVDLVDYPAVVPASGTTPPKAHKQYSRPRHLYHFGRRSTLSF